MITIVDDRIGGDEPSQPCIPGPFTVTFPRSYRQVVADLLDVGWSQAHPGVRGRAGTPDGARATRSSWTCRMGRWCRIVNITPDGTVQVVPEHDVIVG